MHFGSRHDFVGYRPIVNGFNSWVGHSPHQFFARHHVHWPSLHGAHHSNEADNLTIIIGGDDSSKQKKQPENQIKSTKYTLITFLPQNLLEQFKRVANFYFLVMSVIMMLIDSPVLPITSIMPLMFVVSVTATKQGYEDYLRYKADNIVNASPVTVIQKGNPVNIKCEYIKQGDLVQVSKDCDVPCDIVILKSSDQYGKCFVTTANLDGETNLKTLQTPRNLPDIPIDSLQNLGTIECERARTDLYTFNGKVIMSPILQRSLQFTDISTTQFVYPLMADNLLLRGSRVKNTEWIIGCAVYTGHDTKLALNSRNTRNKIPSSEHYINKFLIFILVVLVILVTFTYFLKRYNEMFVVEKHTYIGPPIDTTAVKEFLQDYLSFLILYNYLIPISLYVTIEMHKFLGAFFMEWDPKLYDESTDQPCIVNTSDLNEELGQVNILFSDKTGTLTKNEMLLQQCSINGRKFHIINSKLKEDGTSVKFNIKRFNDDQLTFFEALAICHTVQVSKRFEEPINENSEAPGSNPFENITEEDALSPDSSEMEIDRVDYVYPTSRHSTIPRSITKDDVSNDDDKRLTPPIKQQKKITIADRSKNVSIDNKIHPSSSDILTSESTIRPLTYPSVFIQNRPLEFNRSTSHIDLKKPSSIPTHRRTQSYGSSGYYQMQKYNVSNEDIRAVSSFLSTRQGYVTPFFTRESLISRAESMRRRENIQSFVEKLDYQASSPDEKALVEACAYLGIVYAGDENEIIRLHVYPSLSRNFDPNLFTTVNFKRLEVLEFTSDRKRMSIIAQDTQNEFWIYTKGAESHVFPLCKKDSELIYKTNKHINEFAERGLRTLLVARRKLLRDEFSDFRNDLISANSSIENRPELLEECYSKIEKDLEILGATAVEDALQDHVRDTLESLQLAGIKIWVLTGDKVETAFNIALSCGHIPSNAEKYFMTECNSPSDVGEHLTTLLHEMRRRPDLQYALLVDGKTLAVALKHDAEQFRYIAIKCTAVLCCRLSPLQKCEVVQLVKTDPKKYITAAIGDGANDVSMIQEAHVGLGIVGKEGRQAARCADYSFAKFCMVKRLLLVHGHYYTTRLSLLVLYFFYKNVVFMGVQFLYQFHSMFSATSIYDSIYLTLYNVCYSSLPILILSLTEKVYPEDKLMKNPKLYKENANNKKLHWPSFICWIILAIYHTLIAYYCIHYVWLVNNAVLSTSQTADFACYGTLITYTVVVIVNLKLWLQATYHSYFFIGTVVFSILNFIATTLVYNLLMIQHDKDMYMAFNKLLASVVFWLLSTVITVAGLLPDFMLRIATSGAVNIPSISIFPGERMKLKNRFLNTNGFWNTQQSTNL